VIASYCGRWSIEATFQESRSCLRSETTRGWCRGTVLRATPCLLGLYSVVAVLFHALPADKRAGSVAWPGKVGVTFSDALTAVRRWLWSKGVFPRARADTVGQQLPPDVRDLLLAAIAPAA
jgi:hypothetical protein